MYGNPCNTEPQSHIHTTKKLTPGLEAEVISMSTLLYTSIA